MTVKKASILLAAFFCIASLQNTNTATATSNISSIEELSTCIANASQSNCELSSNLEINTTITINRDVTIIGNDNSLTRNASFTGAFFDISSDSDVTIKNLTLDGGAPNWSVDTSPEALQFFFNACTSSDCRAYGGYTFDSDENDIQATSAIIQNAGTLNLEASTIQNAYNSSTTGGGAIYNTGNIDLKNSSLLHNTAHSGGAIYNKSDTAIINITDSIFSNNNSGFTNGFSTPNKSGGAIYTTRGELNITNSNFENNSSQHDGGAIRSLSAKITIDNSNFINNKTANDGSALRLGTEPTNSTTVFTPQTATIANSNFDKNTSLGYYWPSKAVKPGTEIAAAGNSEGVISYYYIGYSDITMTNTDISNSVASFRSAISGSSLICSESQLAKYSEELCKNTNYVFDGINVQNSIDNSTVAFYIYTTGTIDLENSNLVNNEGGVVFFKAEEANISNTNISGTKTNGTSVVNTNIMSVEKLNIDKLNYYGNDSSLSINSIESNIKNSTFTDNTNSPIYVYAGNYNSPSAKLTIEDTAISGNISNNRGAGIATTTDTDASLVINLVGNTTITKNTTSITEGIDLSGTGGGIAIKNVGTGSETILNIADTVKIENNTAELSGDDISLHSIEGDKGITVNLHKNFIFDELDNRSNENSESLPRTIKVSNGQSLSAANAPRSSYDTPSEENSLNPDTSDNIPYIIATLGATILITYTAISLSSRR